MAFYLWFQKVTVDGSQRGNERTERAGLWRRLVRRRVVEDSWRVDLDVGRDGIPRADW
jgi:hypothetical protein